MYLTKNRVEDAIDNGRIHISNFDYSMLDRYGRYPLTLVNRIGHYADHFNGLGHPMPLDMKKTTNLEYAKVLDSGCFLRPGRIYFTETSETVNASSDFRIVVEPTSLAIRYGIRINQVEDFDVFQDYYLGQISVAIDVVQPVKLYPDVHLCQVRFEQTKCIK